MAPPNRRQLSVVNEQSEEMPRNIVIAETSLRGVLVQFAGSGMNVDTFVDMLNEQQVQAEATNRPVEHDERENIIMDTNIQREGLALRSISEQYMNSHIRNRISMLAKNTDLSTLDYNKFCQIMIDLKRDGDWESVSEIALIQMVFMLTYFKELIQHALSQGNVSKCCNVLCFFIKYISEGKLVSTLGNLICLGLQNRKLAAGVTFVTISSIAAICIYKTFR